MCIRDSNRRQRSWVPSHWFWLRVELLRSCCHLLEPKYILDLRKKLVILEVALLKRACRAGCNARSTALTQCLDDIRLIFFLIELYCLERAHRYANLASHANIRICLLYTS